MANRDFGFLKEASEEGFELSGVIAFYKDPDSDDGSFAIFFTKEPPEDASELDGMQSFMMTVQVMMEDYLESQVH